MTVLETDYLVVGAGAAGMAFTDALVAADPEADVVLVDRRHRPGGHWNDAYPYVRLHLPSAYYGVNSLPLGSDAVDTHGPNAGLYERATGAQVCDYYSRVLDDVLLPTGRVRFLGMTDHAPTGGGHRLVSRVTGAQTDVVVRRKLVDATYLEAEVPATHTPSYVVAEGVPFVPAGGLVDVPRPYAGYVLVGGGKTSMDACLWLLDHGVDPAGIRWIRPGDLWLLDRAGWQPRDQVGSLLDGLAAELEAVAAAASADEVLLGLEACGRLVRLDPDVLPVRYRGASVSQDELVRLREVRDVVRLGRVRRIEPDRIVLEHGEVPTDPSWLHVDCSARGLRVGPARPVFEPDRITLQQVRSCQPCFNAALIGYVAATRDDVDEANRLCPPNPFPDAAADWLANLAVTQQAARVWRREPDLAAWLEQSRLNLTRGIPEQFGDPQVQQAATRYGQALRPAMTRLGELMAGRADG